MKKNITETLTKCQLSRVVKYLKQIDLLTVPYGKGQEFSVMKRKTYDNKLQEVLKCQQFTEIQNDIDSLILKVEKDIDITLLEKKK